MEKKKDYFSLDKILGIPRNIDQLDNAFERTVLSLKDNPNCEIIKEAPTQLVVKININGQFYYFKYDSRNNQGLNEIIVEELAKMFGVSCLHSELASIGFIRGTISKDYSREDSTIIMGSDILRGYSQYGVKIYTDIISTHFLTADKANLRDLNTLEDIWFAFEERYNDRENKQEIVQSLMHDFIKMYFIDIIAGQVDRHANNWAIREYDDGRVELLTMFDNSRILCDSPLIAQVPLRIDSFSDSFLEENIYKFFSLSAKEYKETFMEMLTSLNEDKIREIFESLPELIDFPYYDLKDIEKSLIINRNFLLEIMEEMALNQKL